MFTINIYLRLALIFIGIFGGVILAIFQGFWYALPFLLAGVILLVGYILLGTVQSSAQFMQKMDFDGALNRLKLTANPKWLYKPNRAFYYMVKGSIAMQLKNNQEAEELLLKSRQIGMPGPEENAMVNLQLANLAAVKNNWTSAKMYFKEAKQVKVTTPEIKEQISQFEKVLKNRGVMKAHHRGNIMQQGGKRRRPKMR